jgi:hypothetical protein
MNIKLDAIMKNLDIHREEILQAEDESDKKLEEQKEHMERARQAHKSTGAKNKKRKRR